MENQAITQTINQEEQIKRLEAEKAALEEENRELRKKNKNKEEIKVKLTWWIAKILSLIGLLYLLMAILLPPSVKTNRITNTDVLNFVFILLFNSGIIEKLEDFSIDGTKVQAKFQKLEANQEKQQNELYELQKQQLNLQQKQLETLTNQQREIASLQEKQKIALNFVCKYVVDRYEFTHLKNLEQSEKNKTPYFTYGKFSNP